MVQTKTRSQMCLYAKKKKAAGLGCFQIGMNKQGLFWMQLSVSWMQLSVSVQAALQSWLTFFTSFTSFHKFHKYFSWVKAMITLKKGTDWSDFFFFWWSLHCCYTYFGDFFILRFFIGPRKYLWPCALLWAHAVPRNWEIPKGEWIQPVPQRTCGKLKRIHQWGAHQLLLWRLPRAPGRSAWQVPSFLCDEKSVFVYFSYNTSLTETQWQSVWNTRCFP